MNVAMLAVLRLCAGILVRLFRSRRSLLIENLVLRQQLAVFKRHNSRPRLVVVKKVFWLFLRRFWYSWKSALIVVSPDTVVRWHRSGFSAVLAAHLASAEAHRQKARPERNP